MEQFTIEVERRSGKGSLEARRIRASGKIPCVIYSHGDETLWGVTQSKEFIRAASSARSSQVFSLKSSDKALNGKSALVKEIQRDYVRGSVLHIDFQALKENEEVTVKVALSIVGESIGVKRDGGILTVSAHEVSLSCLPKKIPELIEVNISELGVGDSIHARDLKLAEGVRLIDDPDLTIASVVVSKFVEEAPKVAAEGVAVEGAAVAEGAAPAEGAAATEKPDEKKGK